MLLNSCDLKFIFGLASFTRNENVYGDRLQEISKFVVIGQ